MMFVWRTFKLAFVELATRLIGLTPLELLVERDFGEEVLRSLVLASGFGPLRKGDYEWQSTM
jgi:hypothetical protein